MSDISTIRNKVDELARGLKQIDNYRGQWTIGLKPKLLSRLDYIVNNALPPYWYVTQQSEQDNRESIFVVMPPAPSGVFDKVTNTHYVRDGGFLQFAQTLNGQICVLVGYPYVEGITTRKATEIINTLPPNELSDQAIDGFVETFLDRMREWFVIEGRSPISFKSQQPPLM